MPCMTGFKVDNRNMTCIIKSFYRCYTLNSDLYAKFHMRASLKKKNTTAMITVFDGIFCLFYSTIKDLVIGVGSGSIITKNR